MLAVSFFCMDDLSLGEVQYRNDLHHISMNILIFEYITGGGLIGQPLPSTLAREGDMMLFAAVNDFRALPGCNVFILRDHRLSNSVPGARTVVVEPGESYDAKLEAFAGTVDSMLIIAPENGDILFSLCERYSTQSFELLNAEPRTIRLTSHKFATYRYLLAHEIPQIPTCRAADIRSLRGDRFVMKPEDGVGCTDISLLESRSELQAAADGADREHFIFQPYVQGVHASLSMLCWEGAGLVLSCNRQQIREEGGSLQWEGCTVGALKNEKFTSFADQIARALPGLRGYVGVDAVVAKNEILLVEINPRLTTSYVGLGTALGTNPAQWIMQCFAERALPAVTPPCRVPVEVDLEGGQLA